MQVPVFAGRLMTERGEFREEFDGKRLADGEGLGVSCFKPKRRDRFPEGLLVRAGGMGSSAIAELLHLGSDGVGEDLSAKRLEGFEGIGRVRLWRGGVSLEGFVWRERHGRCGLS